MSTRESICDACLEHKALYHRQYSGVRLCKQCFVKSVEEKARGTIAKYGMFNFDDRIAVAVSGGKDSVSLLHMLSKIEHKYPRASLVAITVDEGIAGYRDEALQIAADNCEKLRIEHVIVSFKQLFGYSFDQMMKRLKSKGNMKQTPCAFCGVMRRKALNIAAREAKADKLATAHTLDDEAQTILLNIFHGDVLRIAKEKPVTDEVHSKLVRRIKPLCEIPEKETTLYAFLKNIRFQSSLCPYASEALRNDARLIIDMLEQKHPGIMFTIFRSINRIRPALKEMASKQGLGECSECGEPTTDHVCRVCEMRKQIM